ncbi:putative cell surface spherulin 4-like protein [Planoprotostelium fungivorum]|uniref:Putative cell surface spherulin 4-like protein n=1 Tax=Planoprotostelium fungivorum TaxID=1890364 RepID=A0A2P6NM19_9EUKA|nr:putative cell surface spherulin 4-like protein [Planoprotostelium fungivorum]
MVVCRTTLLTPSAQQLHIVGMSPRSLILFFLFCQSIASGPSILVPLYQYPNDGTFSDLVKSVQNLTSVQFFVVVNPASGPGSTLYPDSNYIKAISQLNTFDNVITIGYVRTNYGNQPIANVTADINTYAGWSNYSAANISMHGIFFDESPAVNVSASLSFIKNVTDRARLSIPSSTIVTNQGVIPETLDYFTYTDYLVIFEESYQHLSTVNLDTLATPFHSKSSIIIHTVPLNESLIDSLTSRFVSYNVGQLYLTERNITENPYLTLGQSWTYFTSAINRDLVASTSTVTSDSGSGITSSAASDTSRSTSSTTSATSLTNVTTSTGEGLSSRCSFFITVWTALLLLIV